MVLFQKCVRWFGPSIKMAPTAELSLALDPMGNSHKNFLVWNQLLNWNQTLIKESLDGSLPKLCLVVPPSNHDGCTAVLSLTQDPMGNSHKNHLVWNQQLNQNQTLMKQSLYGPLPKLCPAVALSHQDGCHSAVALLLKAALIQVNDYRLLGASGLAHLAFRPCELLPSLFVRRRSVNISHLNLLLRNHWANCSQTLGELSLDGPLPKLCPVIPTSNQDGRQAKN